MLRFTIAKIARAALTILLVMTFAFIVLRMSGDPAQVLLGPDAPQDAVDAFRERWGLNDPLWQQYLAYLQQILSFDFGISMRDQSPAIHLVLDRIPATLAITVPALILKICIGIPAGGNLAVNERATGSFGAPQITIPGGAVAPTSITSIAQPPINSSYLPDFQDGRVLTVQPICPGGNGEIIDNGDGSFTLSNVGEEVVACRIHSEESSRRPFHTPSLRCSNPNRAWSRALMKMPPPQCPPPLTEFIRWPSMSTQEFS